MSQPFNAFGDTDAQTLMMTLNRIAHNSGELLDIPSVSLALLDGQSGELVIWASLGDAAGVSRPRRFRPHEGIEGWVAANLEPLEIEHVIDVHSLSGEIVQRYNVVSVGNQSLTKE